MGSTSNVSDKLSQSFKSGSAERVSTKKVALGAKTIAVWVFCTLLVLGLVPLILYLKSDSPEVGAQQSPQATTPATQQLSPQSPVGDGTGRYEFTAGVDMEQAKIFPAENGKCMMVKTTHPSLPKERVQVIMTGSKSWIEINGKTPGKADWIRVGSQGPGETKIILEIRRDGNCS